MTTYLITGFGRGIGLALAQALLARGERVIGSVRSGEVPLAHQNLRVLRFDVRDEGAIKAAAATVTDPIDVVVNNAGIAGPRTLTTLDADFAAFAEVLDVNVLGPLRVIHAFLPHLRRSATPKVMTVSSQLGATDYPGSERIAYRVSKAAVNKLMQGVASDLAGAGVAVVTVHPGWVRTEMGGREAPLDPAESAAGLVGVLDGLTVQNSGRFLNWDGTERSW